MKDFKNCPLCGKEPELWFWLEDETWAYARVSCKSCCVELKRREQVRLRSQKNPAHAFLEVENEVKKAWNRRCTNENTEEDQHDQG